MSLFDIYCREAELQRRKARQGESMPKGARALQSAKLFEIMREKIEEVKEKD